MDSSSDDEFYDCQNQPIKYYAVACQKDKGKGIVTMDINEARSKLKNVKGCRFSSFYDPLEAKRFAEKPLCDEIDQASKKKSVSQKKFSDPFPNVSQRDLSVLKSAIESGNLDKVKLLVWNNPRHLVTESDSPTLLQVRFRHNALHVAVSFNQTDICGFLLEAISQHEFWQSIYPTADDKCNKYRMQRVLDMYLNAPEVGNLETPLHLAAKFGHKECMRTLLGQELTDTSLRNKAGMYAEEIICQRNSDQNAEKIREIREIFSEKYVVLLDGDGGKVLDPMSHCQLLHLLRQRNDGFRFQPISTSQGDVYQINATGIVRAYIGPIPELRAKEIFYRWSILNAVDASKFEEVRRTDAEKGMECHGRFLANLCGAPWRELWRFLGAYADLTTDEGLNKLEDHLCQLNNGEISIIKDDSLNASSIVTPPANGSLTNMYGSLIRLFSRLTIQSSSERTEQPVTPIIDRTSFRKPTQNQSCIVTSTPLPCRNNMTSLRSMRTPFNSSLVGQGILTATDRQVRHAVLSGHGRHLDFPKVTGWLDSLSEIDPQSDYQSFHCNGFMVASTPLKSKCFKKPQIIPNLPKCLSPLSQIELPD